MSRADVKIDSASVARQLERVVTSRVFERASRSQRLLRFLVNAALTETQHAVKEYTLATEVFDRDPNYDPAVAATVRVEAGRMRSRLREYYHEEGKNDSLLIEVPRGAYAVAFKVREPPAVPATILERSPGAALEAPSAPGVTAEHVAIGGPSDAPTAAGKITGSPFLQNSVRWRLRRWFVSVALACAFLLGAVIWARFTRRAPTPAIHSLAVLPLRNLSGEAGREYFADGTTDELTTQLASVPHLRVISWNSALQEKNTAKPLDVIARELRADAIVEGSVALSGNQLRINAQLIDTRTDEHLWAASFEGPSSEAFALEEAAARGIVAHLRTDAAREEWRDRESGEVTTVVPAAHDAYLRGRNYFDQRKGLASAEQFQRAIDQDPHYASAYAGLALALESEALLEEAPTETSIPKAMATAEESLRLDPENGEGLIAKGSIEELFLWDWAAAQRDLTRGVRLSPGNSYGQMMLSLYFDFLGRPEEAVGHMQTAVEMDPLSFFMARQYGAALFRARHYDAALRQLLYVRSLHPESPRTVDHWIRDVYEKKGMYAEAVHYDLLGMQDNAQPLDAQALVATFRTSGWQAYWKARLAILRRAKESGPCAAYETGLAAMRAGEHEEALTELGRATDRHCYWMAGMRTDPLFDDLRGDPRFLQMVGQLHLPTSD